MHITHRFIICYAKIMANSLSLIKGLAGAIFLICSIFTLFGAKQRTYLSKCPISLDLAINEETHIESYHSVRERYKHCNQTNILCGGDTTWDGTSESEAQCKLHRNLFTYQYFCKTRRRFGKHGDGGYEVCLDQGIKPTRGKCLVYSFGINYEWSFDEAARAELDCEVHSFDPSMNLEDHEYKPGIYFHNVGLWGKDMLHGMGWTVERFSTIRDKLGHKDVSIDIVKIDVEGAEWPAIRDMLLNEDLTNVKQLILEMHSPRYSRPYTGSADPPMSIQDMAEVYNYYTTLHQQGFRLYWTRTANYCCARFHTMVSAAVAGQWLPLCCYETFLINSRYLLK